MVKPGDPTWLDGFAITGIGGLKADQPIRVGPLRKMNFLVGRNNHGKSTLLRAAKDWSSSEVDKRGVLKREALVRVSRAKWRQALSGQFGSTTTAKIDALIGDGQAVEVEDEDVLCVWVPLSAEHSNRPTFTSRELSAAIGLPQSTTVEAWLLLGIERPRHDFVPPFHVSTEIIPAFRKMIDIPEGHFNLPSGEGVVRALRGWERPPRPNTPQHKEARVRWQRMMAFVRDVLEEPDAAIEVATDENDRVELQVRLSQYGELLNIDDLGDGIKQVVMIAAACVARDDYFLCLEEPEIHLHAGLQRKLMRFLAEHTSNQYLIATHSAHILDTPGSSIFHVTHDRASTRVAPAVSTSDVQRICADLGYLASDLLQANYTIWVEGPTDRLYWRRWLQLVDPELVEGVHYAVMVYGGRLVDNVHVLSDSHDEALEQDLIQLLQLGRASTLIIDSDKKSPDAQLHQTVVRLQAEAQEPGSGHVLVCDWVQTVENLIPREILRQAAINAYPEAGRRLHKADDPFADPFRGMKRGTLSKVKVARRVVEQLEREHVQAPLEAEVVGLANKIRVANGFQPIVVATATGTH